ncbi:MAG TPA: hypothetical protein VMX13_16970 [Sedimentisphaerales bacterium]|nr:hypothetical protein [Sedimentisphaerales bacterium]
MITLAVAPEIAFALGVVVGAAALLCVLGILLIMRPWLRALLGGALDVRFAHVVGMRLRGNPPMLLVDAYLKLLHSGKRTTIQMVESCYIANKGRVPDVDTLVMLLPKFEQQVQESKKD